MKDGKKSVAEWIVYTALESAAEERGMTPVELINKVIENLKPRGRGSYTMIQRLKAELLDALDGKGGAVKKKEDTHRMAQANMVFSHFRW